MEIVAQLLKKIDDFVWGPVMLTLLVGTGILLTFRLRFLTWRNLPYALRSVLSRQARSRKGGEGDISPFSALMTALAGTIGTGNIVGVATAMVLGGPGALVWMWISAMFGLTTKFAECMLAAKYRKVNEKGEISGGPMYVLREALPNKTAGKVLGFLFALFTAVASFGIGNLTQANSISSALEETFHVPPAITGVVIMVLVLVIVVGGISSISRVSQVVVPFMAAFYVLAGLVVIAINYRNVPAGLVQIFSQAFSLQAAGGGVIGAGIAQAMRWGVARGVFSNEAGLGSAAMTAAAAATDHPVRQGYISMTGTFLDTIVVCSITGLTIASSGVLGMVDASGAAMTGAALTIAAFTTALGKTGGILVTISIALFAFSTIIGWEYNGEKGFEYLVKKPGYAIAYRIAFAIVCFIGSTTTLQIVWDFSDIMNALMAVPNLIGMIALGGIVVKEAKAFQEVIHKEKEEIG